MWVRNQKTGDREEKYTTVDKLFRTVIDKQIISAPSLTFICLSTSSALSLLNLPQRTCVSVRLLRKRCTAGAAGNEVLRINKRTNRTLLRR